MRDAIKWWSIFAAATVCLAGPARADDPTEVVKSAPATADDDPAAPDAPPPPTANDPATGPAVLHTPVASAPADTELVIPAVVRSSHLLAEVLLYFRHRGETGWHRLPFLRTAEGNFAATIPADQTAAGTLEYYVAARATAGGGEVLRFASPAAPHVVALLGDNEARWQRELLAQQLGNRSRFRLRGDYVNFGGRSDGNGNPIADDYWHAELDYTYRMLGWIYSISAGAGYLGGRNYFTDGMGLLGATGNVGLRYGFAEVRFRFGSLVRFDVRIVLGAGPTKFDGGGGARILIGSEPGTHFDVGYEYLTEVGGRGFLRLAWNTVRWFPMSFTLEATSWPNLNDISGRVYLTVEHRFGRHFVLEASGGYAARTWRIGGPSAGLGGRFEF